MIRINRKTGYADKLRRYKVMLDGEYIGEIHDGEVKDFQVSPGRHTIYLKIDWCRSNKVDFDCLENEVLEFECGNSMKGWRILLNVIYATFLKNKYLWIRIKGKLINQ